MLFITTGFLATFKNVLFGEVYISIHLPSGVFNNYSMITTEVNSVEVRCRLILSNKISELCNSHIVSNELKLGRIKVRIEQCVDLLKKVGGRYFVFDILLDLLDDLVIAVQVDF